MFFFPLFPLCASCWCVVRTYYFIIKRNYGGSWEFEDAGHLPTSTQVALSYKRVASIMILCVARSRNILLYIETTVNLLQYL